PSPREAGRGSGRGAPARGETPAERAATRTERGIFRSEVADAVAVGTFDRLRGSRRKQLFQPRVSLRSRDKRLRVPDFGQGLERHAEIGVHGPQRTVRPQQPDRAERAKKRKPLVLDSLVVDVTETL